MSEQEDTHRLVGGGTHYRSTGTGGPAERFEPGDTLTPTEGELDALPDRFELLPGADNDEDAEDEQDEDEQSAEDGESAASDNSEGDESDHPDEDDGDESDTQGAESDGLTAERITEAAYQELRTLAGQFDDVNGNWGEDRLRTELLTKIDAGGD